MIVAGWEIGTAVRPARGHDLGGDRAVVVEADGALLLGIIDVLGHGATADPLASRAEAFITGAPSPNAEAMLRRLDAELSGTTGAAAGIASLSVGGDDGLFAGVGNTVCRVLGDSGRTLMSHDGVIGQHARIPRAAELRVGPRETVLMHSDGISSQTDWKRTFPEIIDVDAEVAAAEVARRFGRGNDDVSCIVARPVR